jgi:putative flavoprotein involved in K+ transport
MTQTLEPATASGRSPQQRVDDWLASFESALRSRNAEAAAVLFGTDSYWRDLVAFTWNITTVEGRDGVTDLLRHTLDSTDPSGFATTAEPTEAAGVIEAWIRFETATGRGTGYLRLNDEGAWTLLTTLRELKGHEEPQGPARPQGVAHRLAPGRRSWREEREAEAAALGVTEQPYVVVIGGGQGGIALGARLRQLGVPALVLDRHERPGDQWRKRYKSLCLHDPVWYDHLPYLPFPANWPVFSPKDKIADWLEMYTRVMEVPYWSSTSVRSASYRDGRWSATGYGSMNGWVADIVDQETADRVGKVWGLGSDTPKDPGPWEGEQRNMWKPTRQENLWFHGGNLHQSRHYSLYLALQLKARYEGLDTPVYRLAEVHHTS